MNLSTKWKHKSMQHSVDMGAVPVVNIGMPVPNTTVAEMVPEASAPTKVDKATIVTEPVDTEQSAVVEMVPGMPRQEQEAQLEWSGAGGGEEDPTIRELRKAS